MLCCEVERVRCECRIGQIQLGGGENDNVDPSIVPSNGQACGSSNRDNYLPVPAPSTERRKFVPGARLLRGWNGKLCDRCGGERLSLRGEDIQIIVCHRSSDHRCTLVRTEFLWAMSGKRRLRCAIYTRKSTEERLEQEFTSLDGQREACATYIASQVGLGWKLVRKP